MQNHETLHSDQIELLYDAKRIEDNGDEPVVVSQEAVDRCREALGQPLAALGVREEAIESMSLETLASAAAPTDGDSDDPLDLESLDQTPETGGEDADALAEHDAEDESDENPVAALDAEDRDRAEELCRLVGRHRKIGRLPEHTEEWEKEALALVPDANDLDEIRDGLSQL